MSAGSYDPYSPTGKTGELKNTFLSTIGLNFTVQFLAINVVQPT